MNLTVASWNVNSIRMRMDQVLSWMATHPVDVLCVQETKVDDPHFPHNPFRQKGLNTYIYGQKAYNGVAFITPHKLEDVANGFPSGAFAEQKRLISARLGKVRLMNIYAPNGQSPGTEKFDYKGQWYAELSKLFRDTYKPTERILICGDFNIAPEDRDVYDPEALRKSCGFHPLEHEWWRHLMAWGLEDTFRLHHQEAGQYSWWDYRTNDFPRNRGMRIDHVLVSSMLARECTAASIDPAPRGNDQPSDHVPVMATFKISE